MKVYRYAFEKLDVWKMAKRLVILIYKETAVFPREERYGLVSQMRRAAVSVASNLAEGSARRTPKGQAHFTNIAYSSLMELLNQTILSFELSFLEETAYLEIRKAIQNLSFRMNNLRNAQSKEDG